MSETMSEHVDGWIPELVLGTLDGPTRAAVEVHLERCDRCAAEVVAMGDALSLLALSLPPEPPPAILRTSLLTSVVEEQQRREARTAAGRGRFAAFADRLASFFDVGRERARALVELLADPAAWTPGPAEGIQLIHVEAGARFARADAGFVRMAPGVRFPHHRHIGDEIALVLEGGFVEPDGTVALAGDSHDLEAGASHDFVALPGEGCVFAAVVQGGIEFAEGVSLYGPRDD